MAAARFTRGAVAAALTLVCACATFLLVGCGDAQAGVLSLPTVTLPSLPVVGETSVGVTVPSVTVTVPSVTVTTPAVSVTTPSVSASTPSVSASSSGAGTTVSTGSSSSSTPVGESSESPSGGGTPSSPSGGGVTTSPSEAPSSKGSDSDPVAHAASAAAAGSSSASGSGTQTTPSRSTAAGARARPQSGRRRQRSAAKAANGRHGPVTTSVRTNAADASATVPAGASPRGAARVSGSSEGHASSPLESIGKQLPLPLPVPDWSKPIILALLALALWFGVRARVAARRARRLEVQSAALLEDVGVMQAALVPPIPARVGGLAVSVAYEPADGPAAGGDFYDVFVPKRGKVAIILGDVAGHGHKALAQAAMTRYTLRAYLQAGLEPRAALALAGRVLADATLEHFATVAIGVYDAREGRLVYASAGHPPPILHGLQTRQPLSICASPPIGWTVPTGCRQTTVSLPPGAVACFFSDGLIEARCEEDLLGHERVSELLSELGPRPNASKLLARVKAAAVATPDDMAVCIVTAQMSVIPERIHIEELEADAKALEGGHVRRFLETCQVPACDLARAIDRAGEIAAVFGTAVLRVQLGPRTAIVTDVVPGSGTGAKVAQRSARREREPSTTL
jgi:hypothetical protein